MSLKHLARYALSMPLPIALRKTAGYCGKIFRSHIRQHRHRWLCSYEDLPDGSEAIETYDIPSPHSLPRSLIDNTIRHQFELLGWVGDASYQGDRRTLISPGNRPRSRAIEKLIDPSYAPIDWQQDFKSGYRWRSDRLSGTLRYGHEPGVDVKTPWELGRLQHLMWLAGDGGADSKAEFRNQILDFSAANPPGYGVNWMCTMDVAIRAANLLMAHDLFAHKGETFDAAFMAEFHALILAHGKHIAGNLEWHEHHRANHYLADIAGLLYVAAHLPRSQETDVWLAFSVQQLIKEVERQFTHDGANFEASTSYHRLSSEMAIYSTALVLGLPQEKRAALEQYERTLWSKHPAMDPPPMTLHPMPGTEASSPFPDWYFHRLERMAEFSLHITKGNGRIVQIGDNDSGRFFKLCPLFTGEREEHLDHRPLVAAINGLFDRPDLTAFAGSETKFESTVIRKLSKGVTISSYKANHERPLAASRFIPGKGKSWRASSHTIITPPDPTVFDDIQAFSYPDFGLFIWRSPRLFLSIRCGPIGQNGNGGHAHNDQLAVELNIDGEDWVSDPGSYLYTPSPRDRDAYRSIGAHASPRSGDKEPGRLDLGLFRLGNESKASPLVFDHDQFEGLHHGFGFPMYRRVLVEGDRLHIIDSSGKEGPEPVLIKDAASLRRHWALDLPFSPGYGSIDHET